jgi:23S rRNA pseudouridine1911/1915/1917 synthase
MKQKPLYKIIFENEKLITVDKSSGISMGGDRWDEAKERLDNLLSFDLGFKKIYTVHRIDRETSGIVVFAKNRETHRLLSLAFEQRRVRKRYIAIVHGSPAWKETVCDLALIPNGNKKHQTIIDKYRGKKSLTRFILLGSAGNYSVLEALPETGRIHQIRVHAAAVGHPVVCDSLYGKETPVLLSSFKRGWKGNPQDEKPLLSRLGLHALELTLPDLETFTAVLPKDMSSLIKQMEKVSKNLIFPKIHAGDN